MGRRGIIYYIFQRPQFCCCLPVRVCVFITSVLGILLAGVLSIVLWWEVSHAEDLTKKERGSFAGGAIVETLFFLISVVGLIGAIVRKLTFATAYAIGLYVHFLINLSVAAYLLFIILHATRTDTVALCQHAIKNAQAQSQCGSLFTAIRGLYAGLASFVLLVELYGAIIATRYVYQLRGEKREARLPRHLRAESTASSGVSCRALYATGTQTALRCTIRITTHQPRTMRMTHPRIRLATASSRVGHQWDCMILPATRSLKGRTLRARSLRRSTRTIIMGMDTGITITIMICAGTTTGLEGSRETVEGERGYASESPR
ncbi:hypothetical protein BC826DRAFT_907802 [Russula brevipes]|nr:hypothetical protein BC826DRAFT_907802 [Russula brevipes]